LELRTVNILNLDVGLLLFMVREDYTELCTLILSETLALYKLFTYLLTYYYVFIA